jgi:hypothetical protein
MQEAHDSGRLKEFPDVLTFLSWADATVKTSSTIHDFYNRFEKVNSELIVFDVNRFDQLTPFVPAADESPLKQLESRGDLPYRLTVITNLASDSQRVCQRTREARSSTTVSRALPMVWPQGVYSLAHVSIPFAPDDPVYGMDDDIQNVYHSVHCSHGVKPTSCVPLWANLCVCGTILFLPTWRNVLKKKSIRFSSLTEVELQTEMQDEPAKNNP